MKYDKEFKFSSLFFDKTYRARLILALYAVGFIILIVLVRANTEVNNSMDDQNNNAEYVENAGNDNNSDSEKTEIDKLFSYIDLNNYEFDYILYYNDDIFYATGKRYDRKYMFDLSNGDNVLSYIASGELVKAKDKNNAEEGYTTTDFPYYYLNYFDNTVLKSVLEKATKIEDGKYEIDNEELIKYIDYGSTFKDANKDLINEIELELKNNIITAIHIDITNLFSFSDDIKRLEIDLKYSNFGLVDSFDVEI